MCRVQPCKTRLTNLLRAALTPSHVSTHAHTRMLNQIFCHISRPLNALSMPLLLHMLSHIRVAQLLLVIVLFLGQLFCHFLKFVPFLRVCVRDLE